MAKIIKETIHAKGIDIGIYTTNFENEFISLTDIAKYRNEDDPRFVIQNRMRNRNTIEFLGVQEELHSLDFNRVQFEAVKNEAGLNRFVMTPTKWITQMNAIGIVSKAGRYGGIYANEADMLNVVLFGKTANSTVKENMRDGATLNQLLVLANLESYNAVLIHQGKKQKERMELLLQLAVQQLQTLEIVSLNNLPKLGADLHKEQNFLRNIFSS